MTKSTKNGRFSHLILLILTTILGMQAKRMLYPLLLYIIRDNLGRSVNIAGILAFLVFATSFLIGTMRQQFGHTRMWYYPALILGPLMVLANIFFTLVLPDSSPLITLFPLFLIMLAVAAFLQFLAHFLFHYRLQLPTFIFGLLFGLGLDLAIQGAAFTYDIAWDNLIALLILFAAQLASLLMCGRPPETKDSTISIRWAWGFIIFGPFFFLQMLLFQNMARLTAVTQWQHSSSFFWLILSQIIGITTAVTLSQRRSNLSDWVTFSLLLILGTIGQLESWFAALQQLAGSIGLIGLFTLVILRLGTEESQDRGSRTLTLAYGLGILLNGILTFTYYIGYEINLPFSNNILPLLAAFITSGVAFLGMRNQPVSQPISTFRLALPAVLLLFPIYTVFTQEAAVTLPGDNFPVRVITFNLHNGAHPFGYLNLEAMAQQIEADGADIIALQEISRGWVINGSTDMLAWFSERLDMPYIWGPTADPHWGNAILSRYPINNAEILPLPTEDLPLKRGFIAAEIDLGDGEFINVISTHFHHPQSMSALRQQQAQALVDYAQDKPQLVILGDLNATPDSSEMSIIRDAGFVDALVDIDPNFTFISTDPTRQIDYIWHSEDLTAVSTTILTEPTSDHLAVSTTIQK